MQKIFLLAIVAVLFLLLAFYIGSWYEYSTGCSPVQKQLNIISKRLGDFVLTNGQLGFYLSRGDVLYLANLQKDIHFYAKVEDGSLCIVNMETKICMTLKGEDTASYVSNLLSFMRMVDLTAYRENLLAYLIQKGIVNAEDEG